jgi:hypothetical protein
MAIKAMGGDNDVGERSPELPVFLVVFEESPVTHF